MLVLPFAPRTTLDDANVETNMAAEAAMLNL